MKECTLIAEYVHTKCASIFAGFIFRGYSIIADFALLNLWMLAIVPCVSIDV